MPQRPPVTPEVVDRAVFLEELDLAPDGETAYVVRRSTKGLEYPREIWAVPLDRSAPRRLTNGPADRHPRVSVDGSSLAFLSKRRPVADERAADVKPAAKRRKGAGVAAKPVSEPITQVWILPLGGGEAWQLTREEHDVSGFAWSPSGERIAFWGWRGPARFLIGKRDDGKSPTARRIAVGGWRWNETGHLDHRTHLSVVDVREGAPSVPLTEGDYDVSNPRWEPNGRSVLFSAARHELADLYPRPGIWRVAARHADEPLHEPVEILRLRGVAEHAIPSPDGRWLAVIGSDEPEAPDDVEPQLFVAPADGSGSAVPVAPDLDLPIGAWQDTDLNGWMSGSTGGAFWRESDGQTELVALVSRRGRCDPWRFPVDARTGRAAGEPEPLAEGDAACWQLAVAGNGRVAVIGTLGGRAMEVMEPTRGPGAVDGRAEVGRGDEGGHDSGNGQDPERGRRVFGAGTYRRVTTMGSAWQQRLRQPVMTSMAVRGPGGPIETWLASPADARNGPAPLILDIHGGPLGAWAPAPQLEVQMLTSAGYRVALPNIRGSASYGRDWITPHMGHWGEVDAADVMAVIDHLIAEGVADPARIGLLGLSYGGFMVNWLVGAHPDRFAAAVSENGVSNQVAAWALSDSGPDYNRRSRLGEPFDEAGIDALWRQSPLRLAPRIVTPLLLLQAEADLRCPPQDNEQLFLLLRALGKTVEYVLYPESSHTYAITGRPDRRKDRHRRMLEWFGRYLGEG